MKVRKPRFLLALAALAALGVLSTACGGDDSSTSSASTSTALTAANASTTSGSSATQAKISATLTASGSTFALPFYQEAIKDFQTDQPDVKMTYGGGGSGKGRQDLADQVVDWAGTDGLIKAEDKPKYKGGEVLYFPTVAAPITVSYNVSGLDKLQLSPDTIAKIFQRQITNWNDPAIAADNPGAKLPDKAITVAHRSDGSGTTEQFTNFLKAASPSVWTLGSGSTVQWPADSQAGNGNGGVTSIVKSTDGAVGYIDFSDARASGLKFASIKNKAGKFIAPSLDATSAALAGVSLNPDLTYSSVWADGDASYPIASPTWLITYKNQTDKAKGQGLVAWLHYIYDGGQDLAPSLDYAPLPDGFVQKAKAQIDQIVVPA